MGGVMATLRVVALPGDGVGPEVTAAARHVLEAVARRGEHVLEWEEHDVGYAAWLRWGTPITEEALAACREGPAVFLGAVGDPRADTVVPQDRPEAALLRLRRELGCFANLRPARLDPALADASVLRPDIVAGCDFVVVRELTGGIYYGAPRSYDADEGRAVNTLVYTVPEVERVARAAFDLARTRRAHV
ncbi:MAG TPA: isocitrate/isopropylmalate family dehydrogenase, partial [Longimicrobiales bacterium]|nr:isocitrate/isopropylmalate family dehydrogenase [Longimicrobiales bacterium]